MKPFLRTSTPLVVVLCVVGLFPRNSVGASMSGWHSNFESAMAQARKEGKPLLVDVGSENCPACRQLESQTLSHPEVQARLDKFVKVQIDGNQDVQLRQQLGVELYPTVLAFDPNGRQELSRSVGFTNHSSFAQTLDGVMRKKPAASKQAKAAAKPAEEEALPEVMESRAHLAHRSDDAEDTANRKGKLAATRKAEENLTELEATDKRKPALRGSEERLAESSRIPTRLVEAPEEIKAINNRIDREVEEPKAIRVSKSANEDPGESFSFYNMGASTTKSSVQPVSLKKAPLVVAQAAKFEVNPQPATTGKKIESAAKPADTGSDPQGQAAPADDDEVPQRLLTFNSNSATAKGKSTLAKLRESSKESKQPSSPSTGMSTLRKLQSGGSSKEQPLETAKADVKLPAVKPPTEEASPRAEEEEIDAIPSEGATDSGSVTADDVKRWMADAESHLKARRKPQARAMYEKVFREDKTNRFGRSDLAYIQMVALSVDNDDDALRHQAYKKIKEFKKHFPESSREDHYTVIRAILAADVGDTNSAHSLLDNFRTRFPDSKFKELAFQTWKRLPPVKTSTEKSTSASKSESASTGKSATTKKKPAVRTADSKTRGSTNGAATAEN